MLSETEGCAFLSTALGPGLRSPLLPNPTSPSLNAVLSPVLSQKEVFVGFYFLGILKKMMATLEMLLQALFPHPPSNATT